MLYQLIPKSYLGIKQEALPIFWEKHSYSIGNFLMFNFKISKYKIAILWHVVFTQVYILNSSCRRAVLREVNPRSAWVP